MSLQESETVENASVVAYWHKNPELFKEVHAAADGMGPCNYKNCMEAAYEIESRFGYGEALYFVEVLKDSGFEKISFEHKPEHLSHYPDGMNGFFQLLNGPYNLNFRGLLKYALVDAYAQSITEIEAYFWHLYESYLKMQVQLFGEIRDNYPRYLVVAHDVMMLNLNFLERSPSDEKFEELMTGVQCLAHEDDEYSIVVPLTARQIAEEGIALSHCMGSDSKRIASGDMQVLFLRGRNEKDKPLVTLQFSRNRIIGAEGLHRRGLTDGERKFLESWGDKNNIQITA